MINRISTRIRTRKLDRLVAHARMKKVDLEHVNRHDYYGPLHMRTRTGSYFSNHWREVADEELKNM